MPIVSVVIATYRRPDMLTRAVRSALAQTLSDIEVIVAVEKDDAESVRALAAISDPRVRHVENPEKKGPGTARDTGVAAGTGQWLAFLDDDDEWRADKLEKQLTTAASASDVIVTCLSEVVSAEGVATRPLEPYTGDEPIDEWLFGRRRWFGGGGMLQTSSLFVPRRLFDHLRFGQAFHEEWELVIRAVKQLGYKLVTTPEPLVIYYAGNNYPWRRSLEWIELMRDLVTPRAYAGFCLTVVTRMLTPPGRNAAFMTVLRQGWSRGKPTARQLFAFLLTWVTPGRLRQRLRIALDQRHATR